MCIATLTRSLHVFDNCVRGGKVSLERLMLLRTSIFRAAEEEFRLLAKFGRQFVLDICLRVHPSGHFFFFFFFNRVYTRAVSCEGRFDVKPPKFLPLFKRVLQVAGRSRGGC